MSMLNAKGKAPVNECDRAAVSYNGNTSHQVLKDDAHQLYELIVMTLFGKDSYYESTNFQLKRLEELTNSVVANNQLDFIANAILHARYVMNIRSMPLVLTVQFAKALREQNKKYPHLRDLVRDVIGRADQITDMYAVALSVFGDKSKIPIAIKRGVADAFNKFDEYHFGKYNSKNKAVKLRDVLRIVHPKAKSIEQGALFKKIIDDAVEVPYTWETELSKNGQLDPSEQKTKAQLWTELVTSGKMGYMALLRNLRNIIEAGVDNKTLDTVAKRIADEKEVAKSKQLPFRFLSAYDVANNLGKQKIVTAISKALDVSLKNLPQLGQRVWIIVDCSGSMSPGYFYHGRTRTINSPIRTASIFAAALAKANADSADDVRITFFSDDAFDVSVNTDDSVISITEKLMSKVTGGGTNLQAALNRKSKLGFEPDVVVVLSDMQVDLLSSRLPASYFDKDCVKIAINLAPYGSTPLSEVSGFYQLSGWSEKLFDFVANIRNKKTVVETLSGPYKGIAGVKTLHSEQEEE